jgi:CheY-like chemotaxis protein
MSPHKRTVLLVDDFVGIREVLREAFESAGFRVCAEAKNGAEAIQAAMEHRPDLVILDYAMPVMNGLEAAPQLRRLVPNSPIILFTLYGENVQPDDAMATGITSVVPKSDLDMLLKEARSHLQLYDARKAAKTGGSGAGS